MAVYGNSIYDGIRSFKRITVDRLAEWAGSDERVEAELPELIDSGRVMRFHRGAEPGADLLMTARYVETECHGRVDTLVKASEKNARRLDKAIAARDYRRIGRAVVTQAEAMHSRTGWLREAVSEWRPLQWWPDAIAAAHRGDGTDPMQVVDLGAVGWNSPDKLERLHEEVNWRKGRRVRKVIRAEGVVPTDDLAAAFAETLLAVNFLLPCGAGEWVWLRPYRCLGKVHDALCLALCPTARIRGQAGPDDIGDGATRTDKVLTYYGDGSTRIVEYNRDVEAERHFEQAVADEAEHERKRRTFARTGELLDRGWSRAMIRDLLGAPDRTEPSRHGGWNNRHLWLEERVAEAEESPGFDVRAAAAAAARTGALARSRARERPLRRWARTVALTWSGDAPETAEAALAAAAKEHAGCNGTRVLAPEDDDERVPEEAGRRVARGWLADRHIVHEPLPELGATERGKRIAAETLAARIDQMIRDRYPELRYERSATGKTSTSLP